MVADPPPPPRSPPRDKPAARVEGSSEAREMTLRIPVMKTKMAYRGTKVATGVAANRHMEWFEAKRKMCRLV